MSAIRSVLGIEWQVTSPSCYEMVGNADGLSVYFDGMGWRIGDDHDVLPRSFESRNVAMAALYRALERVMA